MVMPLMEAGGPTTATREPSGRRVLRIAFWSERFCPSFRAICCAAASNVSVVRAQASGICCTTPFRSA